MQEKYVNLFTDFAFKKLFGEESNKEFLIDFLNSVFGEYIPYITELEYHKNELLGAQIIDRHVIFDLYCKDSAGNRFIIELQKAKQIFFKERTVFYMTFAVQEQARKGSEWDFQLDNIYSINLLNFNHSNGENYLSFGKILDVDTHETLIDQLNFAYLEVPKFKAQLTIDSSKKEKWVYLLKHLHALQDRPAALQERVFTQFFEQAQIMKMPEVDRQDYYESLKYLRDFHNIETQNYHKGLAEGKEQGLAEGEKSAKRYIAKSLLADGLSLEKVSQITGLSISELSHV